MEPSPLADLSFSSPTDLPSLPQPKELQESRDRRWSSPAAVCTPHACSDAAEPISRSTRLHSRPLASGSLHAPPVFETCAFPSQEHTIIGANFQANLLQFLARIRQINERKFLAFLNRNPGRGQAAAAPAINPHTSRVTYLGLCAPSCRGAPGGKTGLLVHTLFNRRGNLVVGLPARSAGKFWAFWHHLQGVPGFRCAAGEYLGKNAPKNPRRSAACPLCGHRHQNPQYFMCGLRHVLPRGRRPGSAAAHRSHGRAAAAQRQSYIRSTVSWGDRLSTFGPPIKHYSR